MKKIKVDFNLFDPKWKKNGYDKSDALAMGLASYLVYASVQGSNKPAEAKINTQLQKWGFDQCRHIDVRQGRDVDTQAFIARSDKRILVAFRGTDSGKDWIANIQAKYEAGPFPKTKVHNGCLEAYQSASLRMGEIIGELRNNNQEVWVTGHSLGGALAVIFASDLITNLKITPVGLYTYGAPRVGNGKFEEAFNKAMTNKVSKRIVNQDDVVPHVPMEPMFSHTGDRILFRNNWKRVTTSKAWKEFRQKMWSWLGGVLGDRKLTAKDAHSMVSKTGYIARLHFDRHGKKL